MSDPISTLIELNELTLRLDETQFWIDQVRAAHPTHGHIQLELDRKQTEIDEKRRTIEILMLDIARRN